MILQKELGGFSCAIVRIYGSFLTNGAGAPTVIRDGKTGLVASVVRTSAGLYTVTLAAGSPPIPLRPIHFVAHLHSTAAPTIIAQANYVLNSWSQSARTFQIVVYHTSGTPGVGDPDSGDRISFEVVGSMNSAGTDAA